jgi:AraC family transcriptional regulator of adaptative response/methylated-DNA-[protein]-cysteine methyltransferase
MDKLNQSINQHYALVAQAIEFIRQNALQQPTLEQIAAHVGMSEYHFQRVFAQWAGVSPKRFLQFLTKEHAKNALRRTSGVLEASMEVGLSTPSRLHDLIVSCEAMTPGEFKSMGEGITIEFGLADTPFGPATIGTTPRGICYFEFVNGIEISTETDLRANWPCATLTRNDAAAQLLARKIFTKTPTPGRLHVVLKGTNFQIKIWEALLHTERGKVYSYSRLAALAGHANAQRAVGSAMAANIVGYLIPCHRVIQGGGEIGNYRWGTTRKAALLAWEAAQREEASNEAGGT